MSLKHSDPPWNYLSQASATSLQSFELSRLNHAANLRREIGALLDQWLEETSQALLARWLLENPVVLRDMQSQVAGAIESAALPGDDANPHAEFRPPEIRPKLVRQVKPRASSAGERG
jgi:hypothetical protein